MTSPQLPAVYEAEALAQTANLAEEARSRARNGAPEGTLVWTKSQTQGKGRLGRSWTSPEEGLYAALVMRPEFDWSRTEELALVGLVSLGAAVAALVEPMTELRYRWPNDVLVGGTKIGGLWLEQDQDAGFVVLKISCNVGQAPKDIVDGGCLREEGGNEDITPEDLLEQFTRHFLAWINRWDEDGLDPVKREFLSRSDPEGTPVALILDKDERVAGILAGLDEHGGLLIDVNEKRRSISLRRYLELA